MGKVYQSPRRKRPIAKHAQKIVCPLKTMKKAALQSKMASLMQPRTTLAPSLSSTTEEDGMDLFAEAGEVMDEIEEEKDVQKDEDKEDDKGQKKAKRDTKAEAQTLYESWSALLPKLTTALLTYISKSAGKPTCSAFDTSACPICDPSLQSTTRIICLFWDRKYDRVLFICYS